MKKIISLGLMLAAIFTLTNCVEDIIEVDTPEQPTGDFTIALSLDTKTENYGINGEKTKWSTDDKIYVFHAEAGTTNYVNDGVFTISNVDNGEFTGTLGGALAASNDWYFLYHLPITPDVTTPDGTSGPVIICSTAGQKQLQVEKSSTAHLAGYMFPLVGKVAGVAKANMPTGTMNQLASVVKVVVTNTSASPLTVKSVKFTAPTDVVGLYKINFTGDAPTYTKTAEADVSNLAKLEIPDGNNVVSVSGTESFYVGIKPFTATSGQKIKVAVNGYEKEITLSADATFTAGKIKTINFDNDKVPAPIPTSLYIQGTGAEIADAAFTMVEEGVFAIHQKLKSGTINFSSATGAGGTKYYSSGVSLCEGTGSYTVTDTENVTRILIDFNDYTVTYQPVTSVKMQMCYDNYGDTSPIINLTYKNNGVFEGEGNLFILTNDNPAYSGISWGAEERYHFIATIDGVQKCWGNTTDYDPRPDGGQPANYFQIGEADFIGGFQTPWKLATALDNSYSKVTIDTKTFTHSIVRQGDAQLPTELAMYGTGAENDGRALRKAGRGLFVIYSSMNAGTVNFQGSGETYYAAPETMYLVKGSGTSASQTSYGMPVRIYVNFLSRKVTFDVITKVRLLWAHRTVYWSTHQFPGGAWYYYDNFDPPETNADGYKPDVMAITYKGGGNWGGQGVVEWPQYPEFNFGPGGANGRVHFYVYFLDGTVKKWGRVLGGDWGDGNYGNPDSWVVGEVGIAGYDQNTYSWFISGRVAPRGDQGKVDLYSNYLYNGEYCMYNLVTDLNP